MTDAFTLKLVHPKGALAPWVQGLWSATVAANCNDVNKLLHGDACSGLVFVLEGSVSFGEQQYTSGGYFLPNSRCAQTLCLSPGTKLAGIRLHPAVGYAFWGRNFERPEAFSALPDKLPELSLLHGTLRRSTGHYSRLRQLYLYLIERIMIADNLPTSLTLALRQLQSDTLHYQSDINASVSQRQLERLFNQWLSMTPKHCHRVFRIARALDAIKNEPNSRLASIAIDCGFSDQAHMTREFRQIARISPLQFRRQYSG
ncbi:helix-turn-helix domain-containing protein [Thalassotalea fusca]